MQILKRLWFHLRSVQSSSWVALSALFVSFCALVVSIQEVRIMQEQQKLSMYPYLTMSQTYNDKGSGIYIKNSGTGLARVESYEVFNDTTHFNGWLEVMNHYVPDNKTLNYSNITTNGIQEGLIAPNQKVMLCFVPWNDESKQLQSKLYNKLKIRISYASLLDERWLIENGEYKSIEKPWEVAEKDRFHN